MMVDTTIYLSPSLGFLLPQCPRIKNLLSIVNRRAPAPDCCCGLKLVFRGEKKLIYKHKVKYFVGVDSLYQACIAV